MVRTGLSGASKGPGSWAPGQQGSLGGGARGAYPVALGWSSASPGPQRGLDSILQGSGISLPLPHLHPLVDPVFPREGSRSSQCWVGVGGCGCPPPGTCCSRSRDGRYLRDASARSSPSACTVPWRGELGVTGLVYPCWRSTPCPQGHIKAASPGITHQACINMGRALGHHFIVTVFQDLRPW